MHSSIIRKFLLIVSRNYDSFYYRDIEKISSREGNFHSTAWSAILPTLPILKLLTHLYSLAHVLRALPTYRFQPPANHLFPYRAFDQSPLRSKVHLVTQFLIGFASTSLALRPTLSFIIFEFILTVKKIVEMLLVPRTEYLENKSYNEFIILNLFLSAGQADD